MAAANVGSTGTQNGSISTLSAAGTEFQNSTAFGSTNHTVGLGGDEALVVDTQQQVGLDELGLNSGGTDRQDGLIGEHGSTLGHCPDIAGEMEISQIRQELLAEELPATKVFDILRGEVQVLNVLDDLLQTGSDGKAAAIGTTAEEQIEIGNPVLIAGGKIALGHGQLVKITEHGQIEFIVDNHCSSPRYRFVSIILLLSKNGKGFH